MPELPDITVYLEALESRVLGRVLERERLENLFVLRTALPPIGELERKRVVAFRRLGKRIAFGFENGRKGGGGPVIVAAAEERLAAHD